MDSMQQKEHSHDYAALVARLRQGEVIECEISLGIWKGKATASRKTGMFGETLMLTTHDENDVIHITTEIAFIEFCSKNRVEFDEAIGLIEVAA